QPSAAVCLSGLDHFTIPQSQARRGLHLSLSLPLPLPLSLSLSLPLPLSLSLPLSLVEDGSVYISAFMTSLFLRHLSFTGGADNPSLVCVCVCVCVIASL